MAPNLANLRARRANLNQQINAGPAASPRLQARVDDINSQIRAARPGGQIPVSTQQNQADPNLGMDPNSAGGMALANLPGRSSGGAQLGGPDPNSAGGQAMANLPQNRANPRNIPEAGSGRPTPTQIPRARIPGQGPVPGQQAPMQTLPLRIQEIPDSANGLQGLHRQPGPSPYGRFGPLGGAGNNFGFGEPNGGALRPSYQPQSLMEQLRMWMGNRY